MHSSDTTMIFFEDVRVPASHIIGQEGMGFTYQMLQFQEERLWAAAGGNIIFCVCNVFNLSSKKMGCEFVSDGFCITRAKLDQQQKGTCCRHKFHWCNKHDRYSIACYLYTFLRGFGWMYEHEQTLTVMNKGVQRDINFLISILSHLELSSQYCWWGNLHNNTY